MTAIEPAEPQGTIITFYSYKGGTGRTMALANVAWILASSGHRVLAVDWDLESPGLHKYFQPFLHDKTLASSTGVIDMVKHYADAVMEPLNNGEVDWIGSEADVLQHAVSLRWDFDRGREVVPEGVALTPRAYLDILPAGRQDSYYSKTVSTFDWTNFFERLGGNAFLDAMAESMRANYDYILIDSRTGVSDGAGICTVKLPDTIVASFTMNDQSIEGAAAVARSVMRQRGEHSINLVPVAMRIEDAEQAKLDAGRDFARRSFASLLPRMSADEADRYWGEVEIPYKAFYAYEEILAPFGDRPHQEGSLLAAYERLTGVVSSGVTNELRAIDERTRFRGLKAYERRQRAAVSDAFLSYAAVDRMWAEWVADELTAAGLRITMREIDFPSRGF